ncbi:kinase-like protein [Ramicandelaber brevisporus]|nr:kinase-like protein [Ramicandelaber brevisporus]
MQVISPHHAHKLSSPAEPMSPAEVHQAVATAAAVAAVTPKIVAAVSSAETNSLFTSNGSSGTTVASAAKSGGRKSFATGMMCSASPLTRPSLTRLQTADGGETVKQASPQQQQQAGQQTLPWVTSTSYYHSALKESVKAPPVKPGDATTAKPDAVATPAVANQPQQQPPLGQVQAQPQAQPQAQAQAQKFMYPPVTLIPQSLQQAQQLLTQQRAQLNMRLQMQQLQIQQLKLQQQQALVAQQPPAKPLPPWQRQLPRRQLSLNDFIVHRTLGTGSFGRVRLVQYQPTSCFYAMKVLNKSEVVRAKQVEHVKNEREILACSNSPFLVQMLGTFQDHVNLFMVLEFISGGELFSYLRKFHRFPSGTAMFYAGEVLLAFEYLHGYDIIYRDLKPENILIDSSGHIKLTDMGFAKYVPETTWTLCGTPDYLAPETIRGQGSSKAADWYSLGVLIFEMLAGYPPFYDENHSKLYEKILSGRIQWPSSPMDLDARDLIKRLLTHDLTRRYGNLVGGSRDIKQHRWFASMDWSKLSKLEVLPPIKPKVMNSGDCSNFDAYKEPAGKYGDYTSPDPHKDSFVGF